MRYVILGNGICGTEAALALRGADPRAQITLVSAEHDHLFSRPALMYLFAGQLSLRDSEPYDRGLYERMGLERVRGRVVSLDSPARALAFADGRRLSYDRLLLAVGSRARPAPWPGSEGPGVHSFVTLQDLAALDGACQAGMRAVVIGGGLIGVEVAEILRQRGLEVSFLIRENWYFPLALDSRESALVAEHMRTHGIDVRLGAQVEGVMRDPQGRLHGVRASGRDLPADLVVVSIGVVPHTAFLQGSGLALSPAGAIEVDAALRTNLPEVWAAGDCANVTWYDGGRRPEQLWYTARQQGRAVARSMLGEEVTYRRGTWYNSAKFFDLEWTTAGWVPALITAEGAPIDPGPGVRFWFQRLPGQPVSQRIVCQGDRVVGFNMLGGRWNHEPLIEWIHEQRSLDYVLGRLHQAQFDEEFWLRFAVRPDARVSAAGEA